MIRWIQSFCIVYGQSVKDNRERGKNGMDWMYLFYFALAFRWILKKVMGLLTGRKQPADCR